MNNLIYFVKAHTFVKIGYSASGFVGRLRSIAVGCPYETELLGIIPCDSRQEMVDLENRLHSQFAKYNVRNEWFEFNDTISDYVDKHAECGASVIESDMSQHRTHRNAYMRDYYKANPDKLARHKEMQKINDKKPEAMERKRQYMREYSKRPENRERKRAYERERRKKLKESKPTLINNLWGASLPIAIFLFAFIGCESSVPITPDEPTCYDRGYTDGQSVDYNQSSAWNCDDTFIELEQYVKGFRDALKTTEEE